MSSSGSATRPGSSNSSTASPTPRSLVSGGSTRTRPSSRGETGSPGGMGESPVVHNVVTTIGGIGRPLRVTSNQFTDIKKFFEKGCNNNDKTESSGEDNSSVQPAARQNYSSTSDRASVVSPVGVGSSSRRGNSTSSSSTSGNLRLDETGQKEESQSSQSQSDEGEEFIQQPEGGTEGVDRTISPQGASDKHYKEDKSPSASRRFPTCVLDGRSVHKELDISKRTWSNWSEGGQRVKTTASSSTSDSDQDLLLRIDGLLKEKNRVELELKDLSERNQSLQRELLFQRKSFTMSQDRSNDVIERLISENNHLTKSLSIVEKEKDEVSLEAKEIQKQYEENIEKLDQVEKIYREAEQQNQEISDELATVMKATSKLKEQKTKLDGEIQEARKTKDSLRATIQKLRDQNSSLEERLGTLTREKSLLSKERSLKESTEKDLTIKLDETEKLLAQVEAENDRVSESLHKVEREKASLSDQLLTMESTLQTLKGQVEEGKKERESLNKKLTSLTQRERVLKESESHLLKEVECSVNHVLAQYPALKTRLNTSGSQAGKRYTEQPYQLRRMMSLHRAVLIELSRLEKDKESAQASVASLSKTLEEKETQLSEKEKANSQLREEYEALSTESEHRYTELQSEYQEALQSFEREGERHREEMNELLQVNETLEEDIEEVSNSYHAILEEKKAAKASLVKQEEEFCVIVGHLLAEKALLSACFALNKERLSTPPTQSLSSGGDEDLQSLLLEKSSLNESLNAVNTQLDEARGQLKKSQEERQELLLESDKLKVQLMTEISLLKSQVSGLEKDNALLEMQASSNGSIPPGSNSAFQPVVTAPAVSGRSKAQNELVLELQHKVMLLEGENKRLNDIIHNTSSSLDKGNTQRRQLLEMRKKVYFLESEKRQLTDKVSNLHASLKMMRESKDRLTQDRLKSLQEENTSLQDRIRSMEDMFTRKLMNADATIASTAKDNDVLQHKLSLIPEFLKGVKTFSESLSSLSSLVQTQEEELISLKASLSGASGILSPAGDIMERVLKCHSEIQEIIPARPQPDESATPSQRGPSTLTRLGSTNARPPVFQQVSREYISSLEGTSGIVSPVPMRSRSQSQSAGDGSAKGGAYVHQIREKLSSLYADSLSIKDLLKHVHESLGLKQSEISGLQKSFTTFQNELKSSLRVLEETGDSLALLWQRELPSEQLNSIVILKHQVETWQDKVIARDMALKDIDLQMKEDYEAHNRRFSLLKSQVLDLKEEISVGSDKLLARDQYIQELEERSLNAESELYKLRKENEHTLCILQESLNVPEGFTIQLQSHNGNISELVRLQSEELHHVKGILNEYIYQINQLQARLESTHHENSLLKHQSIEQERHHRLVMEELHTERDYLRTLNFQLIEQQFKVEDVGDLLKKLKRSQEAIAEQREIRMMGTELDNAKLLLREKELRISELAHQLDTQKLDALKGHHRTLPTPPTGIGNDVLLSTSHGTYPHIVPASRGFSRPHSASSAESARPPRYTMITDRNHPKVINRSKLPSMLEAGDFLIQLPPSTTNGEGVNVDLEKLNQTTENEGYYIGYTVVTDDEGGMALTDDASPKIPQKNRIKRHRRTASTGSDNLKNFLSSGSSASDSRPPPNHSSTLPHSVARQHRPPKRPGSADSMVYSPGVETSGAETVTEGKGRMGETNNDLIGRYAKDMQEEIGEMINKHNSTNNGGGGGENEEEKLQRTPPLALSTVQQPVATSGGGGGGKEKVGDKVSSKGESQSSKPRIWTHLTRQFGGGKTSAKEKVKGLNKNHDSSSTPNTIPITDPSTTTNNNNGKDKQPGKTLHQQKLFPEDELSATLSRIPSLTSSVGRSDSFASTCTSFSGLGGESSPYSTPSLDSLYIDSFDNMLHLPFYKRGPAYTPVVGHHTSSSDEETRPYNPARTLKRSTLVEKGSKTLPHHFQPVPLAGMGIHHRTTSSCDSDQLASHMTYHGIPLQRSESISISDMDKDLTDHEGMQEKIQSLTKQMGKVRRSSTGSVTICTHSGSSMEDIKGVDQY